MIARNLEHPVWDVYNLLRTARLNQKYYLEKLHRVEKLNMAMQIIIAASLPTSAVASYQIWNTELGGPAWSFVLLLASTLALLQPFLKLSEKIKTYDSILNGYLTLDFDLQELRGKISHSNSYSVSHRKLFEQALKRKKNVGLKEQGLKLDKKLRTKCAEEVRKELPAKNFFIPRR